MKEESGFTPENEQETDDLTNKQEEANSQHPENDNLTENETGWEEKYNELNDSYLRLNAEFDNYRKRTLKEKAELLKTGNERVMTEILPVVDDFERALENLGAAKDVDSVKEGIELIYNKFVDFLLKNGVKKMDVIGQPFDVEKHEALTTIPAQSDEMKDKIVDTVQHGYEMGEKVIRYPKVIIAK